VKRILTEHLEPGLLVTGRANKGAESALIRVGVQSESNHNAMVVWHKGEWFIAEAKPPESVLTPIHDYENLINAEGYEVGFYRLLTLGPDQRENAARYFVDNLLGLKYPRKRRMVLLAMPLYNLLIDKTGILPPIRLSWCSQLCARSYLSALAHCLDGRNGKKKALFTPRTFENRILAHNFEDLTRLIVVNV